MRHVMERLRRRTGTVLLVATLLLFVLVAFLLTQNYASQRRVQEFALEQFRRDVGEKAMAVGYYFSERENDLKNLVSSPAILSFFENQALGMSMAYGLKASLFNISAVFQRFLNERRIGATPIYTGVVFIDSQGIPLVAVPGDKEPDAGMNWKDLLTPGRPDVVMRVVHRDPLRILYCVPYYFKTIFVGEIVAWLSSEAIDGLVGPERTSPRLGYLVCDSHRFPLQPVIGHAALAALRGLDDLKPGVIRRFKNPTADGASPDILALRVPIHDTPLSLISLVPATELGVATPLWPLPLGMGILACVILCGMVAAYRINTQRIVLNIRLDEASKAREEIEAKNRALSVEITERKKIEEDLKELSRRLEQMVSQRTAALSHTIEELNREVEERREAEERLKTSEMQTRRIIEASPVGIFVHQSGRFQYVNPSFVRAFGYETADEIIGRPVESFIFPDDKELAWRHGRDRMAGKEVPLSYEIRAVRKDGKAFPVILGGTLIDYEGAPAILGFVMDVSAERDLRRQLQEAQKLEAIGTLAGGIAHDFNNILSAIIGYAELAQMRLPQESEVLHDLEQVLKAGNRARDLIRQILTVGRQTEERREPMRPIYVVKEALKLLRASMPASIQFDTRLDKNVGTIQADATRIHQVLMNLCTNAQHAMQEGGGTLTVRLENVEVREGDADAPAIGPGPYVRLTVADTGCGMSKGVMSRIFDPYFTTKEKGEGTGLGLAVVRSIIDSYGGKITVASEVGKGTVFHVYFPRIDAAAQEMDGASASTALPLGRGEHILFVDDEVALTELGRQLLETLGYQVTAFTRSEEALALFSSNPSRFDLVITDLSMPGIPGDRLAMEMIRIRPGMPIIVYSGYVEKSLRMRLEGTVARAFIHKPLTVEKLAMAVRDVLDQEIQEG